MVASGAGSETLVAFMDTKSQTLYCWIDWTVSCNLPFSFPENATVRKYSSLPDICTETLIKYLGLLTTEVEQIVSSVLPAKFGVIFDGWTFHSEHYIAVFATFEHDGHAETVLLAMAPLVDDEVEDHSAEAHVTFLRSILGIFNRTTDDLLFVTGDNCSTNGRVAALLGRPLVGCSSHRLHLAVKSYLSDYETLLGKVNTLMCKLRCLNAAAKLRKQTPLRPVLRNATRWSSTFAMIVRFFELKDFICTEDDKIAALMPSRCEENKLQALLEDLKDFESTSLKLQSADGVSLLDVRDLFDALIEQYPTLSDYLAADAAIVHDEEFESACVSVLLGESDRLSARQRVLLRPFETRTASSQETATVTKIGFAEKALKKRKEERQGRVEYPLLPYIPPTSNCVERFFSQAKHLLSHHRTRMLPIHLDMLLFLKANRRFWTAKTVCDVVNLRTTLTHR
ncbi:hypothetical protein BBJ28_00027238 [Nothophytophthora sp. Chile5]|nr:hypothetical protein BBJ28_00027238 [Nothophytophthora sp. Chile5]